MCDSIALDDKLQKCSCQLKIRLNSRWSLFELINLSSIIPSSHLRQRRRCELGIRVALVE